MQKNVGTIDRVVRVGVALVMAGAALFADVGGTWTLLLWIGAIILLATAGMGACPLYGVCRLSTRAANVNNGEQS